MSDAELRALERTYAAEGSLEALDALDQALRRTGRTHPKADAVRLQELTHLVVLLALRKLAEAAEHAAMGMGKTILSLSYVMHANRSVARLARKARGETEEDKAEAYWALALETIGVMYGAAAIEDAS